MNDARQIRIGDAERDAAATALGEHFAAGRLTKDEYDERAEQVWAARFRQDLDPVFADLPSPVTPGSPAQVSGPPQWSRPPQRSGPPQWSRPPQLRGPQPRPFFWAAPILPLLVVGLVLIAFSIPPWPLFILLWIWIAGGFRRHRRHWQPHSFNARR
ncbi:MAG TPA: DUF1707 domain-containing protein [Jiangellaceae bacterium]|nr:DUF1707 domain-containing protein [Jiangellaceae bacterium]